MKKLILFKKKNLKKKPKKMNYLSNLIIYPSITRLITHVISAYYYQNDLLFEFILKMFFLLLLLTSRLYIFKDKSVLFMLMIKI